MSLLIILCIFSSIFSIILLSLSIWKLSIPSGLKSNFKVLSELDELDSEIEEVFLLLEFLLFDSEFLELTSTSYWGTFSLDFSIP